MYRPNRNPGIPLFWMALAASAIGLVAIWDSGYARAASDGALLPRELWMQVAVLILSLFATWYVSRKPASVWRKVGLLAFLAGAVGVALVEVPGLGVTINGATRWIRVGEFTVQPSEFAKLGVLLFLAAAFGDRKPWKCPQRRPRHWGETLDWIWVPKFVRALPFLLVLVLALVIERSPDLDTALVIAGVALAMLFVSGATWKSIGWVLAIGVLVVGVFGFQERFRMDRLTSHSGRWSQELRDGAGYQTTMSEAALASGGLFGVGLGNGRAKHLLPTPTTDFVLATVAEEFGLVGALVVIGLLGGIVWKLLQLAFYTGSRHARLFLTGVAVWVGMQTVVNVLMVNGTLPPVGIPLPFVSYGGSSLLALWLAVGIAMSLSRVRVPQEEMAVETSGNRWRYRRSRLSRA